jgi:hypothetical protein
VNGGMMERLQNMSMEQLEEFLQKYEREIQYSELERVEIQMQHEELM